MGFLKDVLGKNGSHPGSIGSLNNPKNSVEQNIKAPKGSIFVEAEKKSIVIDEAPHNKDMLYDVEHPRILASLHSRMKLNREYLISQDVASEFNTYTSFLPFHTFADYYIEGEEKIRSPLGVRSLFNKQSAVIMPKQTDVFGHSDWRIDNNVPLMDSRKNRELIKMRSRCTVKDLVEASKITYDDKGTKIEADLGKETYSYSDFMFCKYLGKVSNNYLITLRRFPTPVDDYTGKVGLVDSAKFVNGNTDCIGCMVTWLGTPGNEMSNILKYTYSMPFKEMAAKWEQGDTAGDASQGVGKGKLLNNIAAAFDPTYRSYASLGLAPIIFEKQLSSLMGGKDLSNPYSVSELSARFDANKVYGPVDAVKNVYTRSEDGLKFDQNITLTFDYELRAYNGINGRQAMLDLLSNILAVTYTTGTFWGGGYRGGGIHQNNIFSNLAIFKAKGGFNNFVDAFALDYTTVTGKFRDQLKAQGGDNWMQNAMSMMKSALNMMGGMILGGLLNNLGRPQKGFANSLLSPAPVGQWHLTVGNPFHPIMSLGNMIIKNVSLEHYGPLGLDDFPTGLKVVVELTRGKPRDLRGIESIYMHGNDRIYAPMSTKLLDAYKTAKAYLAAVKRSITFEVPTDEDEYSEKKSTVTESEDSKEGSDKGLDLTPAAIEGLACTLEELKAASGVLETYFGCKDAYGVLIASMEQECGASKSKKNPEGGDTKDGSSGKKSDKKGK